MQRVNECHYLAVGHVCALKRIAYLSDLGAWKLFALVIFTPMYHVLPVYRNL